MQKTKNPLFMVVSEDESFGRTLQNNMLWYVGNVLLLYTSKHLKVPLIKEK
ncbi:hypothetical protein [Cloacibacterium normanense]|uniref:hypothetical protein n=1 Tax=Cloacibacterium normanense TaxID=237258 RepID=UPI00352D567D